MVKIKKGLVEAMGVRSANPSIKLFLAVAFCLAAMGQSPIENLNTVHTYFLFGSVVMLFLSIVATIKNFKQSFVPHSIIAISLVFIGNWCARAMIEIRFLSLFGSLLIWLGLFYSIIAVGIYLNEWVIFKSI